MLYRVARGNVLDEYGILFGILIVLSIGGLGVLGHSISDLLGKPANSNPVNTYMSNTIGNNPTNAPNTPTTPASSIAITGDPASTIVTGSSPVSVNATSAEGMQTAIDQNSNVFTTIAKQIQTQPNADPTVVALLTQLANTGHIMGSQIVYTAGMYIKTSNSAQFSDSYDTLQSKSRDFGDARNALTNYLQQYPNVLPANMQNQVSDAETNIVAQTDALGTHSLNIASWDAMVPNVGNVATTIQTNSNTVCNSGGDTTVCVQ